LKVQAERTLRIAEVCINGPVLIPLIGLEQSQSFGMIDVEYILDVLHTAAQPASKMKISQANMFS